MKQFDQVKQLIKNKWTQFSDREKKSIVLGGGISFLLIVYILFWSPLLTHLDEMRFKISKEKELLAWMQEADKVILQLQKTQHERIRPTSIVSFLSTLKTGVQAASLVKVLSQLKQSGSDNIELHFQQANFDQVMRFLISILKQYDVQITQFSVSLLSVPGQTNIDMMMKVNVAA